MDVEKILEMLEREDKPFIPAKRPQVAKESIVRACNGDYDDINRLLEEDIAIDDRQYREAFASKKITLKSSKEYLEKITHREVFAVAYPFGQFNDDTLKAAKESGYSLGFVTDTGMAMSSDNPLKLKRIYISSQYDFNKFKSIFSNVINKSRN